MAGSFAILAPKVTVLSHGSLRAGKKRQDAKSIQGQARHIDIFIVKAYVYVHIYIYEWAYAFVSWPAYRYVFKICWAGQCKHAAETFQRVTQPSAPIYKNVYKTACTLLGCPKSIQMTPKSTQMTPMGGGLRTPTPPQ